MNHRPQYFQQGSPSKYHMRHDPVKGWVPGMNPPYMFGRGWRKFRKHFGK